MSDFPVIRWTEGGLPCSARWRSEAGVPAHKRVVVANEEMSGDAAYRLACEGTALLWRGDFQNARQMLIAMAHRADEKARKARKQPPKPKGKKPAGTSATAERASRKIAPPVEVPQTAVVPPTEAFHLHRLAQSQRARTLGMLLIPLAGDYSVPLRRAPDLQRACVEAYGLPGEDAPAGDSLVSLREVLGLIGAHEWRKKGVEVPALRDRIHPHYGVFAPVRGEYVGLVNTAPLPPSTTLAFDVGTGTGVLAAVLARRGVKRVVATDSDPRALACARDNMRRLKLGTQVQVVEANLFPDPPNNQAPLIICNPPWIPARPSSPIEGAIYDPDSRMLRGYLAGVAAHLTPGGEGWLVLSDIAEHLGLRTRDELLGWIAAGGLKVIDRIDVRPSHPRVADATDPLHAARAAEVTSLWRLGAK